MNSLVLRTLNPIFVLLAFVLLLAAESAVFGYSWLRYFQPQIAIAWIIWFSIKRGFTEGGILTLLIAEICEIHSASPQGYYFVSYMAVYLSLRLSDRFLVLPQGQGGWVLTAIVATLQHIFHLFIFQSLEISSSSLLALAVRLPLHTVTTSLFCYWIYKLLYRLDWITFKNPQAQAAADEELLIEGEVF